MDQLTLEPPTDIPAAAYARGLRIRVQGVPIPQGSMRGFVVGGRARLTSDNPKTRPWKAAVTADASAAVHAAGLPHPAYGHEPVAVSIAFTLPRPKGHFGVKGVLPSAPKHPTSAPDLDKLARAVLDALTGIAYRDDAQVVGLDVAKHYVADDLVTIITVEPIP